MKNFSLSKNERVKLKNDFQKVYTKGKTLYSSNNRLKVIYYKESSVNEGSVKAAFVVSKKAGNAVWRNRIKRLLRESYRNNKSILINSSLANNFSILLIFSPRYLNQTKNKKIKLSFIKNDFIELLEKVKSKI